MRVRWWIALVAVLVVATAIVVVAPWPSGNLRDVADRFDPANGTANGSETYEPRRLLCLGDNTCPSVHRSWSVPAPMTNARLQSRIDAAGYDANVEGDCSAAACGARGRAEGWTVTIFALRNPGDPTTQISLSVQH